MGCDCCSCDDSEKNGGVKKLDDYKEGKKVIKVYFCPKCGSKEVEFIFKWKNVFGVIPTIGCKKCKFTGRIFPLLVVNKEDLKKENDKALKQNKKGEKKK